MNLLKRRWVWILISVFLAIIPLGFVTLHALNEAEKEFKESKWVRTTSGTVLRKELFRCNQPTCAYIGYDGRTEIKNGETQKRVYFQIDNFDQVPEPKRSELMRSEEARIKKFGFRFYPLSTLEKASYDKTQVGDRLEILYRYMGDEKEIINIRNLSRPDS